MAQSKPILTSRSLISPLWARKNACSRLLHDSFIECSVVHRRHSEGPSIVPSEEATIAMLRQYPISKDLLIRYDLMRPEYQPLNVLMLLLLPWPVDAAHSMMDFG